MELVEDGSRVFECTALALKTMSQPQVANGARAFERAAPVSCYELSSRPISSTTFYIIDRDSIEVNRFNPETTVGNIQLYQAILDFYVKYPTVKMRLRVQNHPLFGMVGCLVYYGNVTPFFSLIEVMREVDALLHLYVQQEYDEQLPDYFRIKTMHIVGMLEAHGYRRFSRCGIHRLGNQMSCYDPEIRCEKRFKDC